LDLSFYFFLLKRYAYNHKIKKYLICEHFLYFLAGWAEKYPENPLFQNIELLEKMFKDGKYGMKSGEGFYKYDKK